MLPLSDMGLFIRKKGCLQPRQGSIFGALRTTGVGTKVEVTKGWGSGAKIVSSIVAAGFMA